MNWIFFVTLLLNHCSIWYWDRRHDEMGLQSTTSNRLTSRLSNHLEGCMLQSVQLGNSGLRVSQLCLGTMNFGIPWSWPPGRLDPDFGRSASYPESRY